MKDPEKNATMPGGALVTEVSPESPAATKGLQVGDLIVALNGEVVENQREFDTALRKTRERSTIFLLVWRNDEKFHLGLVREN